MRASFAEAGRILKPGRWITVEFHNSSNAVWYAIQESLLSAGFVVSDVRTLSKIQETYKQSKQGLVKQDLVISAYKPHMSPSRNGSVLALGLRKVRVRSQNRVMRQYP